MKEIILTRGKVALVDDEDFELINSMSWYLAKRKHTNYAATEIKNKAVYMHRFILGLNDRSKLTDHIDHNGLNNQKSNLRITNPSENTSNTSSRKKSTSKYLGVSFNKRDKKWSAFIKKGNLKKNLGAFEKEEDAAKAYNKAALELHKEYANLNIV